MIELTTPIHALCREASGAYQLQPLVSLGCCPESISEKYPAPLWSTK